MQFCLCHFTGILNQAYFLRLKQNLNFGSLNYPLMCWMPLQTCMIGEICCVGQWHLVGTTETFTPKKKSLMNWTGTKTLVKLAIFYYGHPNSRKQAGAL